MRDWPLGPDLGQCCGGRVTSLVETFDRSDAGMVAELAAAEMEATFETQTALDEFGRVARLRLPIEDPDFLPPRQTDLRRPGGVIIERFGDDDTPVLLFGAGMSAALSHSRSRRFRFGCAGSTPGTMLSRR